MNALNTPLGDAEFDQLEAFLASHGSATMNLEMLDGFFTALICGPDLVPPNEYLPEILGKSSFDDLEQANAIFGLLMRHWNTIASALLRTLEHDEAYGAFLYEDEQGQVLGNDWAFGFMRGITMRPDSWQELLAMEPGSDTEGLLFPIMWIIHEDDPDPARRSPAITREQRDDLIELMIGSATMIYRHFASRRR
ncbi:MAG: UPF0149 family protein [Burkholderiaceae bacterium]